MLLVVRGLLLMSLVPSKRIDRIYPIIPPLCLLLAAQIGRANLRNLRWAAAALFLSIFLTLHYVGYKRVYLGYRNHRDSLVTFGATVRDEAARHQWRYDAIVSHDGAMLLYLEKTQFVEIDNAAARWNAGELDAVVAETESFPRFCRRAAAPGSATCARLSTSTNAAAPTASSSVINRRRPLGTC